MIKKKLTNLEIGTLNYFMVRAFLIGETFNAIVNAMRQDCWIIPILSIIPGLIFIFLIDYISKYKENENIANKLKELFKSKLSIILIVLITLMSIALCTLNLLNLSNFIKSQFLPKTPIYIIAIAFMGAAIYLLFKGLNTIGRTGVILFYFSIFLFIFNLIAMIPNINLKNLMPILNSKPNDYLKALETFYGYNIIALFPTLVIPKCNIENPKIKKTLTIFYLISITTIFFIIFVTVSTFGYELTLLFEYPEFHVLKYISLIGLSSRIESILVMQLIIDIFMSIVFIIYFISNNIKSLFNIKKQNKTYLILSFFIVIATVILSKNNTLVDMIIKDRIPLLSTILSIIIISVISIKIKMSKN